MKTPLLVLPLALASCSTLEAFVPGGGDLDSMAAVNLGQRVFDHSSSACLDEHNAFGLEYALWREDGVFGYEFGVHHHTDRGTLPVAGNTRFQGWEATAGLRRVVPLEGYILTPYAGLGLAGFWASRDEEFPTLQDSEDTGAAAYVRFGATAPLSDSTFIGLDVRFIQEEWLNEGDLDLDGDTVSLVLGLNF